MRDDPGGCFSFMFAFIFLVVLVLCSIQLMIMFGAPEWLGGFLGQN
jgi:hypothetical protein